MLVHTCTVACDFVGNTIGIRNATTFYLYKDMESIALPLLVSILLLKNQHLLRILTFIWLQCFYFIEFIYSYIHLEIFPEKKNTFYLNLSKSFSLCKLMMTYTGVYNFPPLTDSSCHSIELVAIKTLIIYMSKWMINNTTVF